MKLLAAIDFSTRSNRALRQAGLIAQSRENAELHIVHVVDDDQPEDMIRSEKREAERVLTEQTGAMPQLRNVRTHRSVVTGDPFDGILRAAGQIKPDLIVMGAHRKQLLLDFFVGTTVERVIRKGAFPVLMVNHDAQRNYEQVIAPVDMSEACARALKVALATGLIPDKGATLLHAFQALAKGKMMFAGTEQASIDSYVANERQTALDELTAFLIANDLKDAKWSLRIEEGAPMEVISRAVSQMRPDLLVMGTRGRSGLRRALIGSVTEEALRSLDVDVLAVPLAR